MHRIQCGKCHALKEGSKFYSQICTVGVWGLAKMLRKMLRIQYKSKMLRIEYKAKMLCIAYKRKCHALNMKRTCHELNVNRKCYALNMQRTCHAATTKRKRYALNTMRNMLYALSQWSKFLSQFRLCRRTSPGREHATVQEASVRMPGHSNISCSSLGASKTS